MPVADDDYKRRLINTLRSGFKTGREAAFAAPKQLPEMMQPNYGLIPVGPLDRMAERQAQEQNRMRLAAMMDPSKRLFVMDPVMQEAVMGSTGGPAGAAGGAARKATVAALRSKSLQEAIKAAEEFAGTKFADEVLGQGTMKASDMPRYAKAGGQKLLDFLDEQLASGAMDVKSANRFVRAFPKYIAGEGADAGYEIVGRNAKAFEDLAAKADDAIMEMEFAKAGLSYGARKYGPKSLSEYLLSQLPAAQSRVTSVLDEWL